MSIVNTTDCMCYYDYDIESRRSCMATYGHSFFENDIHQMVSCKCLQCDLEEAFATTVIIERFLALTRNILLKSAASPQISLTGEGACSECSLLSRILRLCITWALESSLLKHDSEKNGFVLKIVDGIVEQAYQKVKSRALCSDCATDSGSHEGHRTMPSAALANALNQNIDDQASEITKNIKKLSAKGKKVLEKSRENSEENILFVQEFAKSFDKLKIDVEPRRSLEKNRCASVDPILVADRKKPAREPLLIGLFIPVVNVWTPIESLPDPKVNYAVANYESSIFIIGGWNNGTSIQSMEMYDRENNSRRYCNPMRRPRSRPSACFHNHKLYVAGGYDSVCLNSVEIFDAKSGKWCHGPSLRNPRADASMVSCNGELFVLGGYNGKNYEETIEKLDEKTQQFEIFASMNGISGFGACEFRGKIFIAGGWNTSESTMRSVKSFDPKTKAWRVEPSMHKERKYFTLHATNEAIYAIRGNADNWQLVKQIEKFDVDQMKWDIVRC